MRARVYGTQQLNDCPQSAWDAIDTAAITAEYGAIVAVKNGPRYWVIGNIEIGEGGLNDDPLPGVGEITVFGDLEMRLLTLVEPFELLTVDGIAEVVQDELSNTYQRVP